MACEVGSASDFERALAASERKSERAWLRGLVVGDAGGNWLASSARLGHSSTGRLQFGWIRHLRTRHLRNVSSQDVRSFAARQQRSLGWAPKEHARLAVRLFCGVAGAATGLAALGILTVAVPAYFRYPPEFWLERLQARKLSPIFDRNGTLVGSVDTQNRMPRDLAAEVGYVPLQNSSPLPTFERALLHLEDRHFFDGGLLRVCGIDVRSLTRPFLSLGRAGGSGLTQQLAKNLLYPEWNDMRGANLAERAYRWTAQLGAACALHRALSRDGGPRRILTAYTSYAPMWQGFGVLRGLEASANVVFGVAPEQLTDAQQLVSAASVKLPLRVAEPESARFACRSLYPRLQNPAFDATAALRFPGRADQCRILRRARFVAPFVLSDSRLVAANAELSEMERAGIAPVNDFEPISSKKLINLSERTRALMPAASMEQIQRESELAGALPGEPLTITSSAEQQVAFAGAMKEALARIEASASGRRELCMRLKVGEPAPRLTCGGNTSPELVANVLAVKVKLSTGAVVTQFASRASLFDEDVSIGSLSKWIVLTAAIDAGYTAEALLCPKRAWDGSRALTRVTEPRTGFASCSNGRHLISLEQATARSDNLAFYQLAQELGPTRLTAAATALGMDRLLGETRVAYDMAFGTHGASPRELLAAAQALFGVAYSRSVHGVAPRILINRSETHSRLATLLKSPEQHLALRRLLEAPVRAGTLEYTKQRVDAGKTGSTQSRAVDPTGRPYAHGKFSVTYQAARNEINLLMIASPTPTRPLARHTVSGKQFDPALATLIASSEE